MRIIWVLENIHKNRSFYSKLNILLLLNSVKLWKKYHPEDTCVLYADNLTINLLKELNVTFLWDEISQIEGDNLIDKKIFWASAKLQVLSKQVEPVIIMDNDTLVFCRLKDHLDLDTYYVHNLEQGKGYYPTAYDEYIRKLSFKRRWITESVNVSFLYLPDPEFTREYSNLSLNIMKEFTKMKVPNSQYLIFAEQLLLNQLLIEQNKNFKSIVSTYWDCNSWKWGEDHDKGLWTFSKSGEFIKHYGPLKSWIINNKADQNYEREMIHLKNGIKMPNLNLNLIEKL